MSLADGLENLGDGFRPQLGAEIAFAVDEREAPRRTDNHQGNRSADQKIRNPWRKIMLFVKRLRQTAGRTSIRVEVRNVVHFWFEQRP